ncbi:hypothetical protein OEZ85_000994 [Tetradesmus obliquus]|uniref:BRO1 domain-containing protein n=1 Tax=Tetradesmus obliquus TaxID=3088 RepID=A0ABY8UMP0_TETOB|nr:hypothetical protein OEZ85_000994 [Tetradesmus obliquus]
MQAGDLQRARSLLDAFFVHAQRYHAPGPQGKAEARSQAMCRALFAAGQLVSQLSSSFKGQALVDGVLEALRYILQGAELAAANPRQAAVALVAAAAATAASYHGFLYTYLIYNGSVHYWHASRPLQCDQLRSHLLPSAERLNQLLDKVEGQQAWRVRHLMALAMCQAEGPRPEEAPKTLTKAMDVALSAGLTALKHDVAALQTHVQSLQASRLAAGKAGAVAGAAGKAGAAAGGGKAAGAAAGPPPGMAAAARRRTGELAAVAADKLDESGALSILQWVLSSRPEPAAAEQQLRAAWKMIDPRPEGPTRGALMRVVGSIAWAAALSGASQLAEQCARRAAASPDLGPRVWSDLTRLLLALQSAPPAVPSPGSSWGGGVACYPEGLQARLAVLEGVEEAAAAFVKLQDVDGVHYCAKLAWNAGLPLLQPQHRGLLRRCFAGVAKALESMASPLARLRACLHLELARAEAGADSFAKAAKEASLALALNYPPSAEAAALWGYERPLDRFLQPLARAARLRGAGLGGSSSDEVAGPQEGSLAGPDDDAAVLLERAKESKMEAVRKDYLQK